MFRLLGEVMKKRVKELHIKDGINEQIVLGLVEDYLKQQDLFLCIPKSFKNKELVILCAKSVLANEINNKKEEIFDFLQKECKEIQIEKINVRIGN
jgi:hypothetical protein